MQHDADVEHARTTEKKLQDAAQGGTPVIIPGSTDSVTASRTPTMRDEVPPIPSTDDDRKEDRLDGGGKI